MSRMGASRSWLWFVPLPLVALVVVGPMFGVPLGPIDDHEIPLILGPAGHLAWTEVPATVARFADEVSRFRPFYWVIRVVEVSFWGTNAAGWYLDRFVFLLAAMAGAAALAARFVRPPLAALAAILVVAGPQAESWFRLGPQEAIGAPLLLIGLALIVWGPTRTGLVVLVLAALTKEAFVPFALAGTLVGWRNGSRTASVIAAAVILAAGAWIAYLHFTRPDLYLQSRSLGDAARMAREWVWETSKATLWPLILLVAIALGWRPQWRLVTVAVVLLASQAYLYAGIGAAHYLLPVGLLAIAVTIAALSFVGNGSPRLLAVLAVAVACAALLAVQGERPVAAGWAARALHWNAGIAELRGVLSSDPSATVVVVPRGVGDYEPVFSFRRFVPEGRATVAPTSLDAASPVERSLQQRLSELSANGWIDPQGVGIAYAAWAPPSDCVAVVFSGPPAAAICPRTVVIPAQ